MKILKTTKGFTLIELMLVIAIITLLTSVAMFSGTEARKKAQDAKMITESHQVETAIALYKEDKNGKVPYDVSVASGKVYQEGDTGEDEGKYEKMLQPLVNAGILPSVPKSPDGKSYAYGVSTNLQDFVFIAGLNNGRYRSIPCQLEQCDFIENVGNDQTEYTLTINPNDAESILVGDQSINVNNVYSKKYPSGAEIDLYAYYADVPANYWNEGCEYDDGAHCNVIMTSDKTLTPVIIR